MDREDWKRLEELIYQAGGVANISEGVPDTVRADAMAFHTLGLAILDIQSRLAGTDVPSDKPIFYGPNGEALGE
jgi:hypothetical protein